MRRFSSVVLLETLFEISGCSHIAFTSRGATFNKIDVLHWPFFAETSEGVLLRASEHLRSCEAPSAKQDGGGEIRTHEAFRPSGFQDRRDQPLCHPSGKAVISGRHASIAGTQRFARQRHMFM